MSGRTFVLAAGLGYRYGFNGKEKDPTEFSSLTHYDFSARIYNPALGRFLSTDRLSSVFSGWSPYNSVMNSPLYLYDPTGMSPEKCPTCPQDDDNWKEYRDDDRNWTYDQDTKSVTDDDAFRFDPNIDIQRTLSDVVVVGKRKTLFERTVDVLDYIGDRVEPFQASAELQIAEWLDKRMAYNSHRVTKPRSIGYYESLRAHQPVNTPIGKVKPATIAKTVQALRVIGAVTAVVSIWDYGYDISNGETAKGWTGVAVTVTTVALPFLCPPCAAATIVASAAYSLYLEDKIFPGENGRPQ